MDAGWVELFKLLGALVGFGSGVFFTYWRIRQKRTASEMGLADNPERCGKHEEAISTLKTTLGDLDKKNDSEHERMFRELGAMSIEIAKLGRNGNGNQRTGAL